MMHSSSFELDTLAPGLADPVHDAQAVFRVLLDALARPGSVCRIDTAVDAGGVPAHVPVAVFAALLTLCDYATPLWLQQADAALATAVRFHTGAPLAGAPAHAAFAYIADGAAMPALDAFALGTPEAPDQAATLLIRVAAFEGGQRLTLRGPGIQTQASIAPLGLSAAFWAARAALSPLFPCGIDCYLVCGSTLVGLPRTTHVEMN